MSAGIRLVRVTGKCPFCDVRKHQIDGTEERAIQIVSAAIDAHVRDAHPDEATSPSEVLA